MNTLSFVNHGNNISSKLAIKKNSSGNRRNYQLRVKNQKLKAFIDENVKLMGPKNVHIIDGSSVEREMLIETLVASGTLTKLNPEKRPNSYLARSSPSDVARVEDRTLICSKNPEDAGPTNQWVDPDKMKIALNILMKGAMKNRTMYVIPFCMGPLSSPLSEMGIQITDSPYVALSMLTMARAGDEVLDKIGDDGWFVECTHSLGSPLSEGEPDVEWPCNPIKYITHFPEKRQIISFGSGYGGNALLGKKCYALRIASTMARDNGWLAEHCLILGITNPKGEKKYVVAAFPSACGKTNLAMLRPTIPGWKIETVGDDIAWMKWGEDGQLYAINPENGFFGVAPGTSFDSNPMGMESVRSDTIFTNVGLTPDGDVWWEGIGHDAPEGTINWKGKVHDPNSKNFIAHPNSRFCTPVSNCPSIDPNWDDPKGVPISAIIFGGRRATTVPLVYESDSWDHGVFVGSSIASETTAAQEGTTGNLRHDPFAMIPFCGYNMGDYFDHWLKFGATNPNPPKIFGVNWFRKDEKSGYLWPGFGENSRVLKWIFERCDGTAGAQETPIGNIPRPSDLDLEGLNIPKENIEQLLTVDTEGWQNDLKTIRSFYLKFGDKLPSKLVDQLDSLESRLKN